MGQKILKLEEEAAMLDASGEVEVAEYHKLKLDIAQLEKKMMAEITRPERVLYFLLPGRLVKVREAGTDWGWGIVINVVKKPPAALGTLPPALSSSRGISYIVDTLLHCSIGSSENGSRPKPCPPRPGEKGEMHVGDRTYYMCGSPDHFIRDCPAASSPYPMLQTGNSMFPGAMSGYALPFWNSNPLPPIRPFTNMYGNSGMMPFNSGMVPSSPFAVPPYMPSMYGGLPVPSGFMRMGGMLAPEVQTGSERPLTHSENMQLRDCENRWKLSNENLGSTQLQEAISGI